MNKYDTSSSQMAWFVDLYRSSPSALDARFWMSDDGSTYVYHGKTVAISASRWTLFTWEFVPGGTAKFYVNGTLQTGVWKNAGTHGSDTVSAIYNSNQPLVVGKCPYLSSRAFEGVVDEVRISGVGRSDAWVRADYYSQMDKLVSYSAESLTRWDNRWRITVDESKVDSDLSSYPVLIHIGATSGTMGTDTRKVFDEVGASYRKIAFTLGGGCSQLLAEVDSWDNTAKEGFVWVRVPLLSGSANTTLYMYYDKDQADNTAFIGSTGSSVGEMVWDSGFQMVQHLTGASATAIDDASSHSNDVSSATGTPDYNQAGKDGKGVNFDHSAATEESLSVPDANGLDGWTGQATVEVLFKPNWLPTNTGDQEFIISKYTSASNQRSWYIQLYKAGTNNLQTQFYMSDDGSGYVHHSKTVSLSSGTWYQLAWTFVPGGTAKVYLNGVLQSGVSKSIDNNEADTMNSIYNSVQPLIYAKCTYSAGRVFDGVIDEARVSNVGRSDAWLKADYYSMVDGLVSFSEAPLRARAARRWGTCCPRVLLATLTIT